MDVEHPPHPSFQRKKLKSLKEDPSQEPATISEHQEYIKVVGSIQYIACVTQADLAFATYSLARHTSELSKTHWVAAQHVMRYLQRSINLGLQFSASKGYSVVEAYSNPDFANELEKCVGQFSHDVWEQRVLEIKKTGSECRGYNGSRAYCDELYCQ